MGISLGEFSKSNNLPKTSVWNACRELGIDTSDGLDPAAIAELKRHFNLQAEPSQAESAQAELVPDGFLVPSALSHVERKEITLPDSFDPVAVVKHFDGIMGVAADTGRLVEIAQLALNSAQQAMDSKLDRQKQALTQTERDAKQLEAMVSSGATDLKIKALESRILAEQQTKQTAEAEQIFNQLMGLGKPVDG